MMMERIINWDLLEERYLWLIQWAMTSAGVLLKWYLTQASVSGGMIFELAPGAPRLAGAVAIGLAVSLFTRYRLKTKAPTKANRGRRYAVWVFAGVGSEATLGDIIG